MFRVVVDREKCTGYACCEAAAPEVFALGSDGIVEVLPVGLDAELRPRVEEAARSCPERAIRVQDA